MHYRIALIGCSPEPLASYLKALALLRLVSEQKDPEARGWWEREIFHLESELDEGELTRFFLEEYSPTPIVAPWNGGSGFYEGTDTTGREAICNSTLERFRPYRDTINDVLSWPEVSATAGLSLGKMLDLLRKEAAKTTGKKQSDMLKPVEQVLDSLKSGTEMFTSSNILELSIGEIEKEKSKSKHVGQLIRAASKVRTIVKKLHRSAGKEEMVRICRNMLSDKAVEWVDASAILMESFVKEELIEEFTALPLTGTGGNEGNQDYTNAFMRHLAELLLAEDKSGNTEKLLRHALFGEISEGLVRASVGQHDPGRAGGYNQGHGIELKNFPMNPWNFVLTLEGSIAWASGVTRRHGLAAPSGISSAFTVMPTAVGYSSASAIDKAKTRREVWTPLWQRPVRYLELKAILREGRADLGKRQAVNGIEFAESVASLGIDRGITEFVRYSFLERRGKGYYVALPSGRFRVYARSEADLVRNLGPLLGQVDRFLSRFKKHEPPGRFTMRRRDIDAAIYQLLLRGGTVYAKAVIAALGRMEQLLAERDRTKEPKLRTPLSGLDPRWLLAADDGSLEVRIAAALACIGPTDKVGPLRANLTAIDPERPWFWSQGKGQMAWTGNSLAQRLANLLHRRMMDAERLQGRANPTWGGIALRAEDAVPVIEGELDETLIEDLLFGFSLIRWDDQEACQRVKGELSTRWEGPVARHAIPRSWALLKHLFLPTPITATRGQKIIIRPEPAIIPLLCANRVSSACEIASRRLFAAGLAPTRARIPDGENGMRIAAALLLPIRRLNDLSKLVLHTDEI